MQKQSKRVKGLDGETVRHKIQDRPYCCLATARRGGSVLVVVVLTVIVLATMGVGLLTVAYGVRLDAIRTKNETVARLAAEAGYEKSLYWMGQQQDILSALQQGAAGTSGTISLPDAHCDYQIKLFSFVKCRPIYRVVSTGHSGVFNRRVDVQVVQAVSGWDMGMCRVPYYSGGSIITYPVNFVDGETIDMPIHINNLKKEPEMDIYIIGSPRFLQDVGMGESRYTSSGTDKYATVMNLFEGGIFFDQPECKVTDEPTVQTKVDRFKNSTKTQFKFTPATAPITPPSGTSTLPATQLEFFVEDGVGKVRITNNCTVLGYKQSSDSRTWDFRIKPGSGGTQYERYPIYAYHVKSTTQTSIVVPLTDTYTTQSFGGVESAPGGQIFVEGNVVIGGNNASSPDQVIKGTVTVVAAKKSDGTGGNIWIADSVKVSDYDNLGVQHPRGSDDMPTEDNPNALGLITQGVVKVIDPGMSGYATGGTNNYPGPPTSGMISGSGGYIYAPVASPDASGATYNRYLSDPTVVEAAITVGGGGWGAENVYYQGYGGRKEATSPRDDLIVRGTIVEAVRGVVGLASSPYDGYIKHYYLDWRLLTGILPGDMWLRGTYIPAPGGWHDYRAADSP
jgi:hypothetical protein